MIMILIIVDLMVIHMVVSGGRDHVLTVKRLETIQAFYAAEAGMHMSMREMMEDSDEDSDTGTGSISDDTNDPNDPAFGAAQVVVTAVTAGSQTTLTSSGRRTTHARSRCRVGTRRWDARDIVASR
jgi:hypothetical protein